jgi:hypothetical protein
MPRQLRTYVTTSGFFELAVAAPTMKAALDIWGAGPDLFRRGYAKETKDAAIVKATMAKPGTMLRKAVGSNGAFKEHPDPPDVSGWAKPEKKSDRKASTPKPSAAPEPEKPKAAKPQPKRPTVAEQAAERKTAQLYAAAQKKRERDAARAEAAERKERESRERAIKKAEAEIQEARAVHDEQVLAIAADRDALEQKARDEDARWERQKRRLEAALRDARS